MAEIEVERRGPRLWMWAVAVLVLALLAWLATSLVDAEPRLERAPLADESAAAAAP